ncbi:MAG TPA: hypothetical protein VN648_06355, partial [Candidatus Methylomirabilis sp.]|nr:hypothetical protein [Candidatus Methylomirabilis sp.]
RSSLARGDQLRGNALRHITVGRFVKAQRSAEATAVEGELLDVLDELVPGVGTAVAFRRLLKPTDLEVAWGRPSGSIWRSADAQDWLGQRGLPHRLGWPGLLAVGEWTYPGRLIADVVEGAMRVADLITQGS